MAWAWLDRKRRWQRIFGEALSALEYTSQLSVLQSPHAAVKHNTNWGPKATRCTLLLGFYSSFLIRTICSGWSQNGFPPDDFSFIFFLIVVSHLPLPTPPCVIKVGRSREEKLFEVETSSLFLTWTSAFHAYASKPWSEPTEFPDWGSLKWSSSLANESQQQNCTWFQICDWNFKAVLCLYFRFGAEVFSQWDWTSYFLSLDLERFGIRWKKRNRLVLLTFIV